MLEKLNVIDADGKVIISEKNINNILPELSKVAQIKAFLARRKEVIYLGDLSLMKDRNVWDKLLDKKHMHCFRIFSPVDKNIGMPFLFKTKNAATGKSIISDLKGSTEQALFVKERFKEIGVHERYLERFVRELV